MTGFRNILVVVDGHEGGREAFRRAAELALCNQAKLTVIGMVKNASIIAATSHRNVSLGDLQDKLIRERSAQIEKTLESFGDPVVATSNKVLLGGGIEEITNAVERRGYDLVVKAAEGWAGINTPWYGSNDLLLTRACPCPVWIVQPTLGQRYTGVLAAVDIHSSDAERSEVNHLIMDSATAMARQENAELYVVYVWEPNSGKPEKGKSGLSISALRDLRREQRERQCFTLEELAAQYQAPDIRLRTCMTRGRADVAIAKQASHYGVDVIVMGTLARKGAPGFARGNTAENLLNLLTCSTLTVKLQGCNLPIRMVS